VGDFARKPRREPGGSPARSRPSQPTLLIVTAEPYYAVRQPSNVAILENVVREDTRGTTEAVDAKYELMERGGYIPTGCKFDPVILNAKLSLNS
jgi:hypothetical protein